jgi:hypothetical protein
MKFKSFSYMRPLQADYKYYINNIKIFDSEKVLYESSQGWLEYDNKDTIEFDFPTCKRKIKLNLSVKHPFIIKEKEKYTLYIPRDYVNLKELGERLQYSNDTNKTYANYFEIDLDCIMTGEKESKLHKLTIYKCQRFEKTEFGNDIKFWEEKLEEEGIRIDSYALTNLLRKYKLLEKIN